MRLRVSPIIFAVTALALTSCRKDASDVWVRAVPVTTVISSGGQTEGGETAGVTGFPADRDVFFNVEASSIHGRLVSLECSVYDAMNGPRVFSELELSERSFTGQVLFHTPSVEVPLKQSFVFTARDIEGYSGTYRVSVPVCPAENSLLEELSSITLYAGVTGQPDAFSLVTLQPLVYEAPSGEESETKTSEADLVIVPDGNDIKLFSATDVRFVRSRSFDYPKATSAGISSVFRNSVREESVPALQSEDIILVGRVSADSSVTPCGVLKIVLIDGSRVLFNLKRVR